MNPLPSGRACTKDGRKRSVQVSFRSDGQVAEASNHAPTPWPLPMGKAALDLLHRRADRPTNNVPSHRESRRRPESPEAMVLGIPKKKSKRKSRVVMDSDSDAKDTPVSKVQKRPAAQKQSVPPPLSPAVHHPSREILHRSLEDRESSSRSVQSSTAQRTKKANQPVRTDAREAHCGIRDRPVVAFNSQPICRRPAAALDSQPKEAKASATRQRGIVHHSSEADSCSHTVQPCMAEHSVEHKPEIRADAHATNRHTNRHIVAASDSHPTATESSATRHRGNNAFRDVSDRNILVNHHLRTVQCCDEDCLPPVESLLSAHEPEEYLPSFVDMVLDVGSSDGAIAAVLGEPELEGLNDPEIDSRDKDVTSSLRQRVGMTERAHLAAVTENVQRQEVAKEAEIAAEEALKQLRNVLESELFVLQAHATTAEEEVEQHSLEASSTKAQANLVVARAQATQREVSQISAVVEKLARQVVASEQAFKEEVQQVEANQERHQVEVSVAAAQLSIARAKAKQAQKLADHEQAALRVREVARQTEEKISRNCQGNVQSMELAADESAVRAQKDVQVAEEKARAVEKEVANQIEAARTDAGKKLDMLMRHVAEIDMALPEAVKRERLNKEQQLQVAKDRLGKVRRSAAEAIDNINSDTSAIKDRVYDKIETLEQSLVAEKAVEDGALRKLAAAKKETTDARERLQRNVAIENRRYMEHIQHAKKNAHSQVALAHADVLQVRRELTHAERDIEKKKVSQSNEKRAEICRAEEAALAITTIASKAKGTAYDFFEKASAISSAAEAHALEIRRDTTSSIDKQLSDAKDKLVVSTQRCKDSVELARFAMEEKATQVEDELAAAKRQSRMEIERIVAEAEQERQFLVEKISTAAEVAQNARSEAQRSEAMAKRAKCRHEEVQTCLAQKMYLQRIRSVQQLSDVEAAKKQAIEIAEKQSVEAEQQALHAKHTTNDKIIAAREAAKQETCMTEELKNRSRRQAMEISMSCQSKIDSLMKQHAADDAKAREDMRLFILAEEEKIRFFNEQVASHKLEAEAKVDAARKRYELEKIDAVSCENDMRAAERMATIAMESMVNAQSAAKAWKEDLAEAHAELRLALQQQEAMQVEAQQLASRAVYQATMQKDQKSKEFKELGAIEEQKAKRAEELAMRSERDASLAQVIAAERKQQAKRVKETEVMAKEKKATDIERVAKSSLTCTKNAESALRDLFGHTLEARRSKEEASPNQDEGCKEEAPSSPWTTEMTPANSHTKRHRSSKSCEDAAPTPSTPCLPIGWGSVKTSVKEALHKSATTTPKPRAQRRMSWCDLTL